MSLTVLRRIVEEFFRRWPIYGLILFVMLVLGFLSVSRATESYTSSGTIFVDSESLVTAQSGIQSGAVFSYLSPAQFTSQELYGLLQTDVFMASVVERAGVDLPSEPVARGEEITRLRADVSSYPSSENLVTLAVSTAEPGLSYDLAGAIIDEYVQFQISVDIAESGASEAFFTDLAQTYQQELLSARDDIDAALRGVEDLDELSPTEQLEIDRLKEAEALAEIRFRSAADDIEVSKLAMLQTETDVRQSYSIFDPPQRPTGPDTRFFDDLARFMVFGIAGLALAFAWPVISAFTSRTVFFPGDIGPEVAPVIGVVPRISRRSVRLQETEKSTEGEQEDPTISEKVYREATETISFVPPAKTVGIDVAEQPHADAAKPVVAAPGPVSTPASTEPEPHSVATSAANGQAVPAATANSVAGSVNGLNGGSHEDEPTATHQPGHTDSDRTGGPAPENADNPENPENPENADNPENAENPENADNPENLENAENPENAEDTIVDLGDDIFGDRGGQPQIWDPSVPIDLATPSQSLPGTGAPDISDVGFADPADHGQEPSETRPNHG